MIAIRSRYQTSAGGITGRVVLPYFRCYRCYCEVLVAVYRKETFKWRTAELRMIRRRSALTRTAYSGPGREGRDTGRGTDQKWTTLTKRVQCTSVVCEVWSCPAIFLVVRRKIVRPLEEYTVQTNLIRTRRPEKYLVVQKSSHKKF